VSIFSDKITAARKKAGFTQETFAKKLGVSNGAVGNWESGRNFPKPDQMLIISEILNIRADSAENIEAVTGASSDVLPFLSDDLLRQCIEHIAKLLHGANNDLRGRLLRALCVIDEEMKRRGDTAARAGKSVG